MDTCLDPWNPSLVEQFGKDQEVRVCWESAAAEGFEASVQFLPPACGSRFEFSAVLLPCLCSLTVASHSLELRKLNIFFYELLWLGRFVTAIEK